MNIRSRINKLKNLIVEKNQEDESALKDKWDLSILSDQELNKLEHLLRKKGGQELDPDELKELIEITDKCRR